MSRWMSRFQAESVDEKIPFEQTPTTPATAQNPAFWPKHRHQHQNPNTPNYRLETTQKSVYERRLPGDAYITAHVSRLQSGYYDSPDVSDDTVENVRFVAVSFVFHPSSTKNRFKSATISIALHDDTDQQFSAPVPNFGHPYVTKNLRKPSFLRFAPHLLYGAISPQTLDWNFNLAGSLGVAQMPVSASLAPSGGWKASYKMYEMMKIQGSIRTLRHFNCDSDVEDGELVWTLEENRLQKSGLPREFTFVMLLTKGDVENVVFDIEIEPKVAGFFGHYPNWILNSPKYLPMHKDPIDLDADLGQRFGPCEPGQSFNFADLRSAFEDFVSLPGTTYSTSDRYDPGPVKSARAGGMGVATAATTGAPAAESKAVEPQTPASPPAKTVRTDVNIDVYLHGDRDGSVRVSAPNSEKRRSRMTDGSVTRPTRPLSLQHSPRQHALRHSPRQHSLRHSVSRTDLRESMISDGGINMVHEEPTMF